MPVNVFFFRGLSTYGRDEAKWSVFNFGPMYRQLQLAFEERGGDFHPVLGMGSGPIRDVLKRAQAALAKNPVWQDESIPVHLCAHSAGGLIARLIAEESRRPIQSVLTIATPNRG